MELNFHRLWIFLQVVDCGGFSAAASKLFMSQPSVSNQVKQLEASLDTALVDRSGVRIRATAEGEVLAEYARRLFLLADEAVTAVRQVQGLGAGRLSVGGTTTVGTYLLPLLLARFRAKYPQIEVDLYVGNADQVATKLVDGDIGLAVLAGQPRAAQLCCEQILTDQPVVITPADHPLAGTTVPPAEIASERFILRENGSSTRQMQAAALALWQLDDVASIEVWGTETLKQSVHAGLGLSLISEHAVGQEVVDGRIGTLEVRPAPPGRPIVAGYRRDRLLSPAERAFLGLLRRIHDWPLDA